MHLKEKREDIQRIEECDSFGVGNNGYSIRTLWCV